MMAWQDFCVEDLATLNQRLRKAGLEEIEVASRQ
jgi:hypothetical protein